MGNVKRNILEKKKKSILSKCEAAMPWTQGAKLDLNKKSLPKQKTIKTLKYKTQGFQI